MSKFTFTSYQRYISEEQNGKPLPTEVFDYLQKVIYPLVLPTWAKRNGDTRQAIYTKLGIKIANGYNAIVFDDFCIYLEISEENIVKKALQQSSGSAQNGNTSVGTFLMYKTSDGEMFVRRQLRAVVSKNFLPGKYYIAIQQAAIGNLIPIQEIDRHRMLEQQKTIICQAVSCRGNYVDEISKVVSERWPFVKEEYTRICREEGPLSLLGLYQVVFTEDQNDFAIANIYCNMAQDSRHRYAGMNYQALTTGIHSLCLDAPRDMQIQIPYMIGCNCEDIWKDLHLRLSCALSDFSNVSIVKPVTVKEKGKATLSETEVKEGLPQPEPVCNSTPAGVGEEVVERSTLDKIVDILGLWPQERLDALFLLVEGRDNPSDEVKEEK